MSEEREKAQQGLALMEEAVLELIQRHRDNGIRNADIARELGIGSENEGGEHKNWLSQGILFILHNKGKITQKEERGPWFPS